MSVLAGLSEGKGMLKKVSEPTSAFKKASGGAEAAAGGGEAAPKGVGGVGGDFMSQLKARMAQ